MLDEVSVVCPACWEEIVLEIDRSAGDEQVYSEDCSVCCRPMTVHVRLDDDGEGCTVRVEAESD
ncbi:CPXCG motif-containing cysteine-rich protein [Solimonas soli]|uniref:CPXCG motif-containing cysteine-rich protein n=1 Tax=Solimonas soli TaxID=413479 RepID=UPI0004829200|nr:CPXCG motif-containing cysteine-rich protein [Solimonas soli]